MMYLYRVFIVYIVLVLNGVLISAKTNAIRFNANVQKYVCTCVCFQNTEVAMATEAATLSIANGLFLSVCFIGLFCLFVC